MKGARTLSDVCVSDNGAYIWMWSGVEKKPMQVAIPNQIIEQAGIQFV